MTMETSQTGELYLEGKLQIKTAYDALSFTKVNSVAEYKLLMALDMHEATNTDESQNDMHVSVPGEYGHKMRADLLYSLRSVIGAPRTTPEQRAAALALHSTLL